MLVLMPPKPKILSSFSASRNGTPSKVIINHDRYIEFTIYSLEKVITGLDFNPTGEYVVIIDWKGVCLISDVSTNNYTFHKEVRSEGNLIPWNFFSAQEK